MNLTWDGYITMTRVKCKKCGNVFEQGLSGAILSPHVGPYHYMKCSACGKRGWFNIYSSVKDPVTWPPQAKKQEQSTEFQLTEEELERRRIEESKYENP